MRSCNWTIPSLEARATELEHEIGDLRTKAAELEEAGPQRRDWTAELADTRDRLARDLDIRARLGDLERDPVLVDVLGPRPADRASARPWDTAAAHMDQHRAAYNELGLDLLGHDLTWLDSTRYANREAVIQAVTDLDQAVGRQRHLG